MIGHVDGSVLNDDSERPGRGSRTPAVRARSSSSEPVAVGRPARRMHRRPTRASEVVQDTQAAHNPRRPRVVRYGVSTRSVRAAVPMPETSDALVACGAVTSTAAVVGGMRRAGRHPAGAGLRPARPGSGSASRMSSSGWRRFCLLATPFHERPLTPPLLSCVHALRASGNHFVIAPPANTVHWTGVFGIEPQMIA